MRLILIVLICATSTSRWVSAQPTLTRSVLGAAGGSAEGAGVHLDWTLGEPAVQTLSTSDRQLTQGFHQPLLWLTSAPSLSPKRKVQAFPNPTVRELQLRRTVAAEPWPGSLFDAAGRRLADFIWRGAAHQVDMSDYPAGAYWLYFTPAQSERFHLLILKKEE